jgi:hypothetical protein
MLSGGGEVLYRELGDQHPGGQHQRSVRHVEQLKRQDPAEAGVNPAGRLNDQPMPGQ